MEAAADEEEEDPLPFLAVRADFLAPEADLSPFLVTESLFSAAFLPPVVDFAGFVVVDEVISSPPSLAAAEVEVLAVAPAPFLPPPPPLPSPFFAGVDLREGFVFAAGFLEEDEEAAALPEEEEEEEGLEREPRFLTTSGLRSASSLWVRLKLSVEDKERGVEEEERRVEQEVKRIEWRMR